MNTLFGPNRIFGTTLIKTHKQHGSQVNTACVSAVARHVTNTLDLLMSTVSNCRRAQTIKRLNGAKVPIIKN